MRKPAKHCFAGGCPALSLERTGEDFNRGRFAPMRFAYLLRTLLTANTLYVKLPLRFPFFGAGKLLRNPKKENNFPVGPTASICFQSEPECVRAFALPLREMWRG